MPLSWLRVLLAPRLGPQMLVAPLQHIAGTRWGSKMYMDVKRLENRRVSTA